MTYKPLSVRHLPWMPLKIETLRRSKAWRRAKKNKALLFVMQALWMASWQSDEAATLEDDDELLMDLACCDDDEWAELKEQALEGWERREDGKLFHKFVYELAVEALSFESRKAAANRQRAKRQRDKGDMDQLDVTGRDDIEMSRDVTPCHAESRQQDRTGQDSNTPQTPKGASPSSGGVDEAFEQAWREYPKRTTESGKAVKVGKQEAKAAWKRLSAFDREAAAAALATYAEIAGDKPVDMVRYLKHHKWDGLEVEAARTADPPSEFRRFSDARR